ncbi:hypothetical protein [Jeotgalibacillus aurantiacus]|uniref:hypothetical protein n=1 Tax=Jeotgalibacillus aurantiacus TaxID=2763266 RepID=UPI001D0A0387|nr:hypothetical protein [Jeotgalibacillus aurantiacus]
MNLIRWSYAGRGRIRAYFEEIPHSTVFLSRIRNKYFVRYVDWHRSDPVVSRDDLAVMERIINDEQQLNDRGS